MALNSFFFFFSFVFAGHFPCCWGTLSEQFAKLGDSIYFQAPTSSDPSRSAPTVFVNLFESSTLRVRQGVTLRQTAGFPNSRTNTTTITTTGGAVDVKLRVPFWATDSVGNSVMLNGRAVAGQITPSSYMAISLQDGDQLDVYFPLSLRFEQLDDARPAQPQQKPFRALVCASAHS